MRPQEIDESNWTEALEQYLVRNTPCTATIREHLSPVQQHVMRELRDRLPVYAPPKPQEEEEPS